VLRELKPNEFEKARSLFRGFDYSLSVHAAIEGNNPGRIFVDDVDRPRTALALTVEVYLLAGDDGNLETNWTRQQEEFDFLHDAPEWDAVLVRMEG
jgi:hypothetical protein